MRNPSAATESDDREDPIDPINGADRGEGEEAKSDGRRKTTNKNPNQTAKSQRQQNPQTGNKNPNVTIETWSSKIFAKTHSNQTLDREIERVR
jgi:hypothetical protein